METIVTWLFVITFLIASLFPLIAAFVAKKLRARMARMRMMEELQRHTRPEPVAPRARPFLERRRRSLEEAISREAEMFDRTPRNLVAERPFRAPSLRLDRALDVRRGIILGTLLGPPRGIDPGRDEAPALRHYRE